MSNPATNPNAFKLLMAFSFATMFSNPKTHFAILIVASNPTACFKKSSINVLFCAIHSTHAGIFMFERFDKS